MGKENALFLDFCDWLVGVLEEDPLPYEISTLYFFYGEINGGVYIRFCGTEIDLGINSDFTYNPLEAQYFYSINLFACFNKKEVKNIKLFIESSIQKFKKINLLESIFEKTIKVGECNFYF